MKKTEPPILQVKNLKVHFPVHQSLLQGIFKPSKDYVHAIDGISFDIKRKETFAIVGESGSGKTTLGRAVTLMVKPCEGQLLLDGVDLLALGGKKAKGIVRKKVQMIFQDPFSSLNPRKTVGHAISVPLRLQKRIAKKEIKETVARLLAMSGLQQSITPKYPHELSGGQRQRVVIARALAAEPEFLIADEPVSKLDLSIKAQIINLFCDLQEQMGLTIMFIAHDLRMAKHISNRIAVMYHGHIVEIAQSNELFKHPVHPYTKALLNAIPSLNPENRKKAEESDLKVQEVELINPPLGCRYFKSCPTAKPLCQGSHVVLREMAPDHWVACNV